MSSGLSLPGRDYARFLAAAIRGRPAASRDQRIPGRLGWGVERASAHYLWQQDDNGGFKSVVLANLTVTIFVFTNGDSGARR